MFNYLYFSMRGLSIKLLLSFLPLLVLVEKGNSQTFNFTHYSTSEGLAGSTIYYLMQDREGYMWVATENGVNRFDGQNFELFTTDEGLADNEILQIHQDKQGRIWFLSLNGKLSYYYKGSFYNPENNNVLKKAVCNGSLINFLETKNGDLWFATNQNGILHIKKDNTVSYLTGNTESISNCILQENKLGYIIGTKANKVFEINPKTEEIKILDDNLNILPANSNSLFKDGNKTSAVITKSGLYDWVKNRYIFPRKHTTYSSANYQMGIRDKQNNIWASKLRMGLSMFNSRTNHEYTLFTQFKIMFVMEDKDHNIWIATSGAGLFMHPYYNSYTQTINRLNGLNTSGVNHVIAIGERIIMGMDDGNLQEYTPSGEIINWFTAQTPLDGVKDLKYLKKKQQVWYANNREIIVFDAKNLKRILYREKKRFAIKSIEISDKGQIAIPNSSSLYFRRTLPGTGNNAADSVLVPQRAFSAYFSKEGNLWFSNILGLHVMNAQGSICLHDSIHRLTQRVTDIKRLEDGRIVCSTYGSGILLLKGLKLDRIITSSDGLLSNICKTITIDKNTIWVATGLGLSEIVCDKGITIRNYGVTNGLISNEISDILIKDKKLYLASRRGLTIFQPSINIVQQAPPLYLVNVLVNKRKINLIKDHSLKHNENNITVNFIALDYTNPRNIIYRYRLNDKEKWTETDINSLVFPSLEPGNYRLTIEAKTLHSGWSNAIYLSFNIKSPIWQTWWFISVLFVIFVISLVAIIMSYLKNKQNKEREKLINNSKIIALEQQALQAMMNPHFIFNVMNSIQYFINTQENRQANFVLSGFAKLIRKNLDICNKSKISLEEEIEYLNLYLSLEKIRFGNKMSYEIKVTENIDTNSIMIPTMLLQPYVENAIWHGIMPKSGNGKISIIIEKESLNSLLIQIIDDGIGYDPDSKSSPGHISRGMNLTRQRLELFNKSQQEPIVFKISKWRETGTEVNIKIPILPFAQSDIPNTKF